MRFCHPSPLAAIYFRPLSCSERNEFCAVCSSSDSSETEGASRAAWLRCKPAVFPRFSPYVT